MLLEMLKRISTQGSTEEPEACTSAITTEKVEDIFPFSDDLDCMDQNDLFLLEAMTHRPYLMTRVVNFQCPKFLKVRQNILP